MGQIAAAPMIVIGLATPVGPARNRKMTALHNDLRIFVQCNIFMVEAKVGFASKTNEWE